MSFRFRKALRENAVAAVALVGIVLMASVIGGYILSNQRLNPPAWVPVIGEDPFEIKAELRSAQGILPGQGQAVNVSGVKVGDIASVDLEDGVAVATLRIEERFARVYPDATVLLRPKTNVKDMVIELDPGTPGSGPKVEEGATISSDDTLVDVNVSDFLESLDGDTREYLQVLMGDAGRALGNGGGEDLASTFRRFAPLSRDVAKASRLVVRRRHKLRRVMTNFSRLISELGSHDRELARFVKSGSAVFERFANQNENLAETIELLPPALESGNEALASIDQLGGTLETTLGELRPTARALGPAMRGLRPFFRETRDPIRTQIRPFAREAQPIARELVPVAEDLNHATPSLRRFWGVLNALFNELAYDPPGDGVGDMSYLFFVPWASHNTNSTLAQQDGIGPLRRGVVYMRCGAMQLFESFVRNQRNPTLVTTIQLLNAPRFAEVCRR
jgi:phospholipid/cholesterol/gamma-HCH transport system substrate-binding protein